MARRSRGRWRAESPARSAAGRSTATSIWLAFCAVFLIGLVDWRRPLSLRTLDLLVLLSFSVSLWFFNHGRVFAAVVLAYPPLVWLLVRCAWIGFRGRPVRGRIVWPIWLLAGAAIFVGGFRVGMNVESSNVIDVGYSGVIGADRIVHGESPYGHFPIEGTGPHAGRPTRTVRSATTSRRTAVASRRTPMATRTDRSHTRPISPATWRSAGVESGTTFRPFTRRRFCGTCSACSA